MADARELLDKQLKQLGRSVLISGGKVSSEEAKRTAEAEYDKFDEQRRAERRQEADDAISALAQETKKLPKNGKHK